LFDFSSHTASWHHCSCYTYFRLLLHFMIIVELFSLENVHMARFIIVSIFTLVLTYFQTSFYNDSFLSGFNPICLWASRWVWCGYYCWEVCNTKAQGHKRQRNRAWLPETSRYKCVFFLSLLVSGQALELLPCDSTRLKQK